MFNNNQKSKGDNKAMLPIIKQQYSEFFPLE